MKSARAEEAPAMDWIKDMEARATGLWGAGQMEYAR
ncbi:hypothetical protein [Halocynthiibacter styelae]